MASRAIHQSLTFPSQCNHCGALSGGILHDVPSNTIPYALAREHYVPSTTEIPIIQALISSCQAFLHTAEPELSTLASYVSDTQAYKSVLHSLLSPINQMPNDILGEIFSYLCEDFIDVGEQYGHIWVLRQVCTHWRNVVDSRSLFWRKIKLGYSPKVYGTLIKQRVRTIIKHSQDAPLRVSFLDLNKRGWRASVYDAIRDIFDESSRWESLEATDLFISHSVVQSSLQGRSLANIRELYLCDAWDSYIDVPDLYYNIFRRCSIEHLQLESSNFPAVFLNIPMNNLRS
ncbi:hypothetical protein BDQ17DRAFT_1433371 [Cyathus striatus]|nr:hypothetical protein BDQ17DRAFT_1433371 [Cyathus striatus]